MLNRHFLRGRVLQSLYAYHHSGATNLVAAEKNLFSDIRKIQDLFVIQLSMLFELQHVALHQADLSKAKLRRQDDLSVYHNRFADNLLLAQLEKNQPLQKALLRIKPDWTNEQELFRNFYAYLPSLERYQAYVQDPSPTYEKDKQFLISIFKNQMMGNKDFREAILYKDLYWESEYAPIILQALYFLKKSTKTDSTHRPLPPLFYEGELDSGKEKTELDFAGKLFTTCIINNKTYESYIFKKLKNWDPDRVASIDILILKMGITELLHFPSIPALATLNEYIELAKDFSTVKSNVFVNGLLNTLIVDFRSKGMLLKDDIKSGIKIETES